MRVLHLDSGRTMRGGQLQVLLLLEGLQRVGFEQTLLAKGKLRRTSGAGPLKWSTIYERAGKADLIHAHDARSHTLALLLGRGRPIIVSRRVAFPVKSGPLSRLKYSQADHYLAVSAYVKDVLVKSGVASNRVDVVYDALEAPEKEPAWRSPSAPMRVAVLASNDPLKRTKESVEACKLAGLTPIVGRDLKRALADSDAFLYLPALEGLGSALLAAAALKKPTVANSVGGIPEVVIDGETGLLTDGSVEQAAAALKRLADDHALGQTLAENAYQRLTEQFSSDIMVSRTADVYRSLFGR